MNFKKIKEGGKLNMSYVNFQYGISETEVLYFKADRFYTDTLSEFQECFKRGKEIVSFDCGLFNLNRISEVNLNSLENNSQILAIVINPSSDIDYKIDNSFEFCGFDLCEKDSVISAITNCGCAYSKAIDYSHLNEYGLIADYKTALQTKNQLKQLYPYEEHANCHIVKIWRYVK